VVFTDDEYSGMIFSYESTAARDSKDQSDSYICQSHFSVILLLTKILEKGTITNQKEPATINNSRINMTGENRKG